MRASARGAVQSGTSRPVLLRAEPGGQIEVLIDEAAEGGAAAEARATCDRAAGFALRDVPA
jgi:hypothetical protein